MHEVSIAVGLLDIIEQKCREQGYGSVQSVKVRVGKCSGILPEAFRFAFDLVKAETVAHGAEFIIDLVSLGGVCRDCGTWFTTEEAYLVECPSCASTSFKVNQGYELELVEMEVN